MPGDTLLTEGLISELLSRYDLPQPIECRGISSGLNDVYLVTTGAEPAILKLYRAGWRSRSQVLDEIAALCHLAGRGVRVALPVACRDGDFAQAFLVPEGERQAVLFTHAPGKPVSAVDDAGCRLFGRALAEVHGVTDDFVGGSVPCDLEHLLDLPFRALAPLLEDRPEDWRFLRDLGERLRAGVAGVPHGALDWGFCHGDFRPANAFLDEERAAWTIFDFEGCGTGFRAYDLATFRFYLVGGGRYVNHEALWRAFLEGYAERRPLNRADLAAIPLFVALRPIRVFGTLLQTARRNWNLEAWGPARAGPLPGTEFFNGVLQFLRDWDIALL
jgi:Ser/Thr protein kinase RdoA (MazF antagonist)